MFEGLSQAIEKIAEMAVKGEQKFEQHEVNGELYVNQSLYKVKPEKCEELKLSSLCALTDFVKTTVETNGDQFAMPLIVRASYDRIYLQSSLDKNMDRNTIAIVNPILPEIYFNNWMSMEKFIIQLQTCFVETDNKTALINIVSQMTDETKVTRTDDGLGQKVTVTKGTGLKEATSFPPIVKLVAYRTYQEVEQVETMYLIRVQDGGELKIMEADGGAWKTEAQRRVSAYLREQLAEEIEGGTVVVVG